MSEILSDDEFVSKMQKEFKEIISITWDFFNRLKNNEGMLFIAFLNPNLKIINCAIEKIKTFFDFDEVLLRSIDPYVKKEGYKYFIDDIPIEEWMETQDLYFKNYARLSKEFKDSQKQVFKKLDELRNSDSDKFHIYSEQYVRKERKEKLKIPSVIIAYIYFKSIKNIR